MLAECLFSLEFLRFLPDSVVANNLLHPAVSGRRYERAAPVLQRRQFSTLNICIVRPPTPHFYCEILDLTFK